MARFIDSKKLNKEYWDNLVNSSCNGLPYAYSWYLDKVSENWGVYADDDFSVGIPICYKKRAGVNIIYQPKFTRQFGFYGNHNNNIAEEYFNYIISRYKEIIVGLDPDIKLTNNFKLNHKIYTYQTLALNQPIDRIKNFFSENAIRQIKKAIKQSLTINTNLSPEEFVAFFKKHKAAEINELNNKDYSTLLKLINAAKKKRSS